MAFTTNCLGSTTTFQTGRASGPVYPNVNLKEAREKATSGKSDQTGFVVTTPDPTTSTFTVLFEEHGSQSNGKVKRDASDKQDGGDNDHNNDDDHDHGKETDKHDDDEKASKHDDDKDCDRPHARPNKRCAKDVDTVQKRSPKENYAATQKENDQQVEKINARNVQSSQNNNNSPSPSNQESSPEEQEKQRKSKVDAYTAAMKEYLSGVRNQLSNTVLVIKNVPIYHAQYSEYELPLTGNGGSEVPDMNVKVTSFRERNGKTDLHISFRNKDVSYDGILGKADTAGPESKNYGYDYGVLETELEKLAKENGAKSTNDDNGDAVFYNPELNELVALVCNKWLSTHTVAPRKNYKREVSEQGRPHSDHKQHDDHRFHSEGHEKQQDDYKREKRAVFVPVGRGGIGFGPAFPGAYYPPRPFFPPGGYYPGGYYPYAGGYIHGGGIHHWGKRSAEPKKRSVQ